MCVYVVLFCRKSGPRLFYVTFMYIENKGFVVGLLHKFNALV